MSHGVRIVGEATSKKQIIGPSSWPKNEMPLPQYPTVAT